MESGAEYAVAGSWSDIDGCVRAVPLCCNCIRLNFDSVSAVCFCFMILMMVEAGPCIRTGDIGILLTGEFYIVPYLTNHIRQRRVAHITNQSLVYFIARTNTILHGEKGEERQRERHGQGDREGDADLGESEQVAWI